MTNLGKYNEGVLAYERVTFPTDAETVQAALKNIGIDGILYEEIFIANYESDIAGLREHLGEYESIDELNHLACVLSELDGQRRVHQQRQGLDQSGPKPGRLHFLSRN